MSPIQPASRPLVMLTVCLLAVAIWQLGEGSWIYAKARLAQVLLRRAWSRTLAGEWRVTPWSWADTWPVGRLRVPSEHIDVIVLNGAYGRTLAFGPALAESSAMPGTGGTTILTGHRDTHFAFLQRLKETDDILFDLPDGRSARYRVRDRRVVDARTDSIRLADDTEQLVLITCYPFDAILAGGPLRYLVRATRVPPPLPRSFDGPGEPEWDASGESAPPW
ncbi:MAG TPA: class GN sortase [Nitrospira sp.]|nr:class GN sortase [Nitrospira sp.]